MRKPLLMLAMAGCHWLAAQSPLDSLRQQVNRSLAPIRSALNGKILYEQGDMLIPAEALTNTDKIKTNPSFSGMLFQSLESAGVPFEETWEAKKNRHPFISKDRVELAVFDLSVVRLNASAGLEDHVRIQDGVAFPLVPVNQIVDDVDVQVVGPLANTIQGKQVQLAFPGDLWFDLHPETEINLEIYDGNQWQRVNKGGTIRLELPHLGENAISYRFRNGAGIVQTGAIEVLAVEEPHQTADLSWYLPPKPNLHAGGSVHIQFSPGNTSGHLKKPLILVEGADYHSVAPKIVQWDSDFQDLQLVFGSVLGSTNIHSVFDLVFLNYNHGSDKIENNARLLEDLIAAVNLDKVLAGSTETNVVIGYSMGGLVARYCLSDMYRRGMVSQTPLLITHDSPHQGANIPLGIQYAFQQIHTSLGWTNCFPHLDQAKAIFDAPATRQMLIYRATGINSAVRNSWLESVYKPMVTFPPGMEPFRFVATSLGSECGVRDFPPLQTLFDVDIRLNTLAGIQDFVDLTLAQARWDLNINARGFPETGTQTISSLKLTTTVSLFNGRIKLFKTQFSVNFKNPSGYVPVDHVPGGVYPIAQMDEVLLGGIDLPAFGLSAGGGRGFTFIPARSALDMEGESLASYNQAYNPWTHQIPVHRLSRFRAAEPQSGSDEKNFVHSDLTSAQTIFLVASILGQDPGVQCPAECNRSFSGEGVTAICPGQSGIFSISGEHPESLNYHWVYSTGLSMDWGLNEASASFSVDPANTNPNLELKCEVSSHGCSRTVPFSFDATTNLEEIQVQCGSQPNVTLTGDQVCQNQVGDRYFYISSIPMGGPFNITWEPLPASNGILAELVPFMSNGIYRNARYKANGASEIHFRVKVTSDCGSKTREVLIPFGQSVSGTFCLECQQGQFSVVEPREVDERLDVVLQITKPEGESHVKVEDGQGNLVFEDDLPASVNGSTLVGQLDAGNYTVRVEHPETGTWDNQSLIVNPFLRIQLQPNPATDFVDVSLEGIELPAEGIDAQITDYMGVVLMQLHLNPSQTRIPIQHLNQGLYFIRVGLGAETIQALFRKETP